MKDLIEQGFKYLDYLVAPPLKEMGGILGDQVGYWRYKRALVLEDKVKKLHEERNVVPKEIPLKTFVHLVNEATLEEDEGLMDMWASLLANATSNEGVMDYTNVYIRMLADLSSVEAKALQLIWLNVDAFRLNGQNKRIVVQRSDIAKSIRGIIDKNMAINEEEERNAEILCNNLTRVGILKVFVQASSGRVYELTDLGQMFLDQCVR